MSASAKTRSFTGKQFKEVWRDISLADWLVVVSEARPDGGWKIKGDGIEGRCPFPNHQDSSPSFNMKPGKGIAKCFGCQKGSTNPIHFVADIKGTSWTPQAGVTASSTRCTAACTARRTRHPTATRARAT